MVGSLLWYVGIKLPSICPPLRRSKQAANAADLSAIDFFEAGWPTAKRMGEVSADGPHIDIVCKLTM